MFGLQQTKSDASLFIKTQEDAGVLALLVYVDNIVVGGSIQVAVNEVMTFLKSKFKLRELGIPRYVLGVKIVYISEGTVLNQRKHTLDMQDQYGILGAKAICTPIEPNKRLRTSEV